MNSVLLIGNIHFTTSIIAQVRGLDALSVTTVATAQEALHSMKEKVPDVAIAQACQLIDGSVIKTFHSEKHVIYFVVIEESIPEKAEGTDAASLTPLFFELPLSQRYLEKTAGALEAGADAYIWLPPSLPPAVPIEATHKDHAGSENLPQTLSQNHSPTSVQANGQANGQVSGQTNGQANGQANGKAKPYLPLSVFHRSQRRLIQAHIQMGLNRAQRYRDLSRINDWLSTVALVDALTQLGNRRAFDLELPNQVKIARRKGTPLSIMVIDIDFFKSVNDRYGHLVGDDVLKMLSQRLLANMRFYDMPFRYGGEEFVITLSDTDLAEGHAIAERLRQSIVTRPFEIDCDVDTSALLPLTISVGLSELRLEDDLQGRSFFHRADQNLFQAKTTGRNRVVSQ